MSNGDKILSENYLQHSDHFARILNTQEASKIVNLETNNTSEKNSNEKNDELIADSSNKESKFNVAD